jgi:hypothetical protein
MHLFMVQVDYRLLQVGWLQVSGIGCYNGISHNDSVIVVPSFYFYIRVVGQGKYRWL